MTPPGLRSGERSVIGVRGLVGVECEELAATVLTPVRSTVDATGHDSRGRDCCGCSLNRRGPDHGRAAEASSGYAHVVLLLCGSFVV